MSGPLSLSGGLGSWDTGEVRSHHLVRSAQPDPDYDSIGEIRVVHPSTCDPSACPWQMTLDNGAFDSCTDKDDLRERADQLLPVGVPTPVVWRHWGSSYMIAGGSVEHDDVFEWSIPTPGPGRGATT